jgi:hypothetical protein
MSKLWNKIEKEIENGAEWVGVYEGYTTKLNGPTLIDCIKEFNSCYNSNLSYVIEVESGEIYEARMNDEPDCRGNYNNSYYLKDSDKVLYNEDVETRPIVKLKPVPVGKGVEHGYIDRRGRIFECGFECHSRLAKELFLSETIAKPDGFNKYHSPDKYLDDMGWVKISSNRVHHKYETKLSESQKKSIIKWMEAVGHEQYEYQYTMMSIDEIIIEINE